MSRRRLDCGMHARSSLRAARWRPPLLAFLIALLTMPVVALAQIGHEPDSIVSKLTDYGLEAVDGGHVSATGFRFAVTESLGTAVGVSGEGSLSDANARFLGALIGAASGYGPEIAAPVTDFFRSRSGEMVGVGEVAVQVQEYLMFVTVSSSEPPAVTVRFEPQEVPADVFGPAAHSIGPADAEHVIREFTDLQCPFCARFAIEGMPVIEELMANGDVRFEVHHFPLKSIHPNATVAAEASECVAAEAAAAGGPGAGEEAFWTYTDALFAEQSRWASVPDPLPLFAAIAAENDLTADGLNMCVRTGRFSQAIEDAYRRAAQEVGLTGTPTVFVDGLKVGDYLNRAEYERLMQLATALAAVPQVTPEAEPEPDPQGEP